jgi:hypothetical protein
MIDTRDRDVLTTAARFVGCHGCWGISRPPGSPRPLPGDGSRVSDSQIIDSGSVELAHMLRTQVEEALAELVALGLVNSDSFGGLRALLVPSAQRRPVGAAKRRGRVLSFGMESAALGR